MVRKWDCFAKLAMTYSGSDLELQQTLSLREP